MGLTASDVAKLSPAARATIKEQMEAQGSHLPGEKPTKQGAKEGLRDRIWGFFGHGSSREDLEALKLPLKHLEYAKSLLEKNAECPKSAQQALAAVINQLHEHIEAQLRG